MRVLVASFLLVTLIGLGAVCSTSNSSNFSGHDCVAFAEASKHLGAMQCVRGTVLHVERGAKGVTFLSFCQDSKACPFTVVVFPADLKRMGDVRQLEGRQIEIKGTIQDYDGRAEIILRKSQQLGEGAFLLFPTVPTDYDVEREGRYKAGKFARPKEERKKEKREGDPISIEDPDEP
jgi:DNA/RNA endonuclease YhcR with UshA esterase domain